MNVYLLLLIGVIIQIIAIPLIAILLRFLVRKLKFKDTTYKKALIVTAIYIVGSYIAEILLYFLFFNNGLIQGIGLLIVSVSIWIFIIKKFYEVEIKQTLLLFLYYHIAIFIIAIIIAIIGVFIINLIEPLIKPPDLVLSGCHNHCIKFSNYESYQVKKEDKIMYTCYCILDIGDKIKTIQFPVDYDYNALLNQLRDNSKEFTPEELRNLSLSAKIKKTKFENMIEDNLWVGKVRTYSVYSSYFGTLVDYEVNVIEIDMDKNFAIFDINGQIIERLSVNQSSKLLDGTELGIISFFYDNETANVEFYLGSD